MTGVVEPRAALSTVAEDRFVELFAEAFGVEKVQLLSPEHPVQDIYGATRFVDFANRERRLGLSALNSFAYNSMTRDLARSLGRCVDEYRLFRVRAGVPAGEEMANRVAAGSGRRDCEIARRRFGSAHRRVE